MSKATKMPLLEWIASSLGFILLATLVSVIGYDAIADPETDKPAIAVTTNRPIQIPTGFLVPFRASNRGRETAAAVQIEGQLVESGSVIETSLATIDYVPGHGTAEGGLFYSHDPNGLTMRVRALGYQKP